MADVRLIDANALLDKNNWTIKQYSEEEANAWRDGIALMKKNIETLQPSTRKRCTPSLSLLPGVRVEDGVNHG